MAQGTISFGIIPFASLSVVTPTIYDWVPQVAQEQGFSHLPYSHRPQCTLLALYIMQSHCSQFLLGITAVLMDMKYDGCAFFGERGGGVNKVHYDMVYVCDNGVLRLDQCQV